MEQNQQQFSHGRDMAPIMTIGNWIVTMIIMIIPIVNIVMLIVWAASKNENPNRKNWAIAQLIFMGIGIAIYLILLSTILGSMSSLTGY